MDKLASRGWNVYAVTPQETIKWEPNSSKNILKRVYSKKTLRNNLKVLVKKVIPTRVLKKLKAPTEEKIIVEAKKIANNCPKCDIAVATYWTTAYAANMLSQHYPVAYHMQHYEELFINNNDQLRSLARITYGFPLFKIANSKWLAEIYYKLWMKQVPIVNPAIDHNIFNSTTEDTIAKYESCARGINKVRIVTYADDRPFKAWDDLRNVMEIVFNIAGKDRIEWITFGGGAASVSDLPLNHLGKLHPHDLANLYRSAHIVLMPSWYESFPLPPLEAMACGTSVICTQYGTEDYAINNKNALITKPREINEIANLVVKLVNDNNMAKQLALEGIKTASNFNWDRSTDCLEGVLRQAISEGKKRCQLMNKISAFANGFVEEYYNLAPYIDNNKEVHNA
jgi:glycosyltransferase involved in cell wall biosynthesis